MRIFLATITIVTIYCFACYNNYKKKTKNKNPKEKVFQSSIDNWLTNHKLKPNNFIDTKKVISNCPGGPMFGSLKNDSSYKWYPSPDSSYSLVSNYQESESQNIYFQILNHSSNLLAHKMILPAYKESIKPIDHYWQNNQVVNILFKKEKTDCYTLRKMSISSKDTIWEYNTCKGN